MKKANNKYNYKVYKTKIVVTNGEDERYNVSLKPYRMHTDELDFDEVDFEKHGIKKFKENTMVFRDGYAVDNKHQILLVYKTVKELMENPNTDWYDADFYDDGEINFYQIQYSWQTDVVVGTDAVEEWLKKNTTLLAEKTA